MLTPLRFPRPPPRSEAAEIEAAGATHVVTSATESGLALGAELLGAMGASRDSVWFLKAGLADALAGRWVVGGVCCAWLVGCLWSCLYCASRAGAAGCLGMVPHERSAGT